MARLSHEEKEKRLSTSEALYFNHSNIETIGDIIHQLFFINNLGTYYKKKDGSLYKQQTGNLRSIDDTYILAKSYLKDVTYEKVYDAIQALYGYNYSYCVKKNKRGKLKILIPSYCHQVKRRVHSINYGYYTNKEQINNILNELNLNFK